MIYAYLPSFSILIKGKYKFSNGLSKINYRTFLCLIPQVYLTLLLSYYLIFVYWYPTDTFTNETTSPRPKKKILKKGFQTSTLRQGKNFGQTLFGTICNTSIKDKKETIDQLSEHFILLWPLTY